MAIARSSTGVYHSVVGAASECNGRSFRRGQTATEEMIRKAPAHMFCKKCFPRQRVEDVLYRKKLHEDRGWN